MRVLLLAREIDGGTDPGIDRPKRNPDSLTGSLTGVTLIGRSYILIFEDEGSRSVLKKIGYAIQVRTTQGRFDEASSR